MAAFFENPLFLFVDEAEPILPIYRSPEYSKRRNDSERRKIVELADVGCDTETTFPIHFLRGKFNRRRERVEGFESARRIIKGRNDKPTDLSARTILDDFENRKDKYMKGKSWRNYRNYRNDRNDVYNADLNCNSCVDDSYDDWKFSNNAARYNDCYSNFISPRNMIGRSRKECLSQNVRYSRNYENPFLRGNWSRERAYYQREDTCPLSFVNDDERNVYETRNIDSRSRRLPLSEHRKRMRIFPETDKDFIRDAEDRRNRGFERQEREDVSLDYVNSVRFSKNDGWNFTSLENEPNCEESISSNSATVNNRRHLWETTSQNFYSQQTRVDATDSENSEFTKTREKNNFVDLPTSKGPIKGARYQISKNDVTKEKLGIFRPNLSDTNTPHVRSTGITTDQRLLNVRSTEKATADVRLCSLVEERKNDASSATPTNRRTETANSTASVRARANKSEIGQPTKDTSKLAAVSTRSNERVYRKNNAGSRVRSANKNDEIDRADQQTVSSRSVSEEVTEKEGTSTFPHTGAEKKKNVSRLPVRTWKRVRTRGPVALHLEDEAVSEAVGEKLRDAEIALESAQLSKPKSTEDDEEREKMARGRASGLRSDLKQNDRHRTGGPFVIDKLGSTFDDLRGFKGTKNLNTSKERRKRTN